MQKIHRETSDYRKLMAMRAEIEATLHRMVVLLDDIDAASEDLEPSLAGFGDWTSGRMQDLELDEAEQSGIGDLDGLYEQLSATVTCPSGVSVE